MLIEVPFQYEVGFDGLYGLQVTEVSDEIMRGRVLVREDLKQAAGLVHGGVYASIAESLASIGTALAVMPDGKQAMGLSNQTSFLRPITHGTIHALATRKHRGRSTWVWEVEISDDQGRLCVLTRMTVAVRDAPAAVAAERSPNARDA
ncbi:MAG TPA: PaaI family thioesterase [Solirubrobacteraceae bacterium]|nr:PaaI family thioesterase [Solirubrobacteraceae bacterium]